MKRLFLIIFLASATACSSSSKKEASSTPAAPAHVPLALPTSLDAAINQSPYRTQKNTERDQYRHPLQTLQFLGIKPEMTVIEIDPGGGWYQEILAPYLAARGQYVAVSPPSVEMNAKVEAWAAQHPEVGSKMKSMVFDPPKQTDLGDSTADMVLTFRNVHNWMNAGGEKEAFRAFFKALKPGGILGLVEHRANAKAKRDPKAESGYVREKDVMTLAKSVGFKLAKKSEINANPKDTKDYAKGVWTLPPTFTLKDQDHDKYAAIGESDRMTLQFVKPMVKLGK